MSEKLRSFLESVCVHIKQSTVHKEICEELSQHIRELQEEFLAQDQTEEESLDTAIAAMGDPGDIGQRLDKQHRPQTEWSIIILCAAIAFIGAVLNFVSRNMEMATANFGSYIFSAALGVILLFALYFFDYTKLKNFSIPLYAASLVLLVLTMFQDRRVNGAATYLFLGPITFSVSLLIIPLIIAFAGFTVHFKNKGTASLFKLTALALPPIFILLLMKFSLAIIFFVSCAAIIITAVAKNYFGGKKRFQIIFIAAAAFLSLFFVFCSFFSFDLSYRSMRVAAFVESFLSRGQSDPTGYGYQAFMADKWLNASLESGSLFGSVTSEVYGSDASLTLPALTTDFALINVFVTLGRAMGFFLIALIALFIIRLFSASFKIKNVYGFYLSLSACIVLSVQFVCAILVNLNLLPTASVYFPFISYGGTGYISSMILVGLVLSAWRRNNILPNIENKMGSAKNLIEYPNGRPPFA